MEIVYKTKNTVDFDKFLIENGFIIEIMDLFENRKSIKLFSIDPNIVFKFTKHESYETVGLERLKNTENESCVSFDSFGEQTVISLIEEFAVKISNNNIYIYKKTPGNEMNPATFLKVIEIPKLNITESMFTIKCEYI